LGWFLPIYRRNDAFPVESSDGPTYFDVDPVTFTGQIPDTNRHRLA
jgi:hypothetical protein